MCLDGSFALLITFQYKFDRQEKGWGGAMLRLFAFLFGLIGLLTFQAQAGPAAGAANLANALSNTLTLQNPIIRVQSGGASLKGKGDSSPGGVAGRGKHRVVIFTDDKARVAPVLSAVKKLGYNKDSYVADKPNKKWNIKWGAASTQNIEEILGVVKRELGISSSKIDQQHKFKADDTDIFINLRFATTSKPSTASPSGRGSHRVVIFTNDEDQVRSLLSAIKSGGFHKESYIAEKPNDDWNIKWGAASSGTIDEVLALVDSEMGIPARRIRKSKEFEAGDTDIFLNLKF